MFRHHWQYNSFRITLRRSNQLPIMKSKKLVRLSVIFLGLSLAAFSLASRFAPQAQTKTDYWEREAFPALGQGDLDVGGVINALRRIGYFGVRAEWPSNSLAFSPDEGCCGLQIRAPMLSCPFGQQALSSWFALTPALSPEERGRGSAFREWAFPAASVRRHQSRRTTGQ